MSPICCVCGEELVDWEGNVMVNSHRYFSEASVDRVQIWCKSCTYRIDRRGVFCSLWELSWARDNFIGLLSCAIGDLVVQRFCIDG